MAEEGEVPLWQLVAVLPTAQDLATLNSTGLWKILQYYLLSQSSLGIKAVEVVQDGLKTGVPYVIPFCFEQSEAESMAGELRGIGYRVRLVTRE